jgi:hypothetical protein
MAFGIDDIIGAGLQIINKFIPDPAQQAAAQLQLLQLQQSSEFKELDNQLAMAQTQTDTNKQEANSTSLFVAGWRPFIGWICGSGLAWNYAGLPLVTAIMTIIGHPVTIAQADLSEMMPLLIGMLGLGGMRTYEKINGVKVGH